ncbi:hypothetical protein BH09PSE1_BH09PSE1_13970 [soil metagenome]
MSPDPRSRGVRSLSFIIALFGVVALLTLGTGGAWAGTGTAAPMSCHDRGPAHDGMALTGEAPTPADAPVHAPAKAPMMMACCVACVTPSQPPAPVAVAIAHPRPVQPALAALPGGRSPSPEPGPPKPRP